MRVCAFRSRSSFILSPQHATKEGFVTSRHRKRSEQQSTKEFVQLPKIRPQQPNRRLTLLFVDGSLPHSNTAQTLTLFNEASVGAPTLMQQQIGKAHTLESLELRPGTKIERIGKARHRIATIRKLVWCTVFRPSRLLFSDASHRSVQAVRSHVRVDGARLTHHDDIR